MPRASQNRLLPAPGRSSFTVVEMLVAIAVLSLLLGLIASITGTATRMADSTGRHADVIMEARQLLDRMEGDLAGMVLRSDVDQVFATQNGNNALFFYSQVQGYFDAGVSTANQSPVSLVGYRVNTSASTGPVLERLAQGMTWAGSGAMTFLTMARTSTVTAIAPVSGSTIAGQWATVVGTAPAYVDGSSSYYHAIGSQVFRFEYCFQRKDGTYAAAFDSLTNTAALVVAIATLDEKSRRLVSNFTTLTSALPDPTSSDLSATPPVLMEQKWTALLNQASFASAAGIPAAAADQIRVYQRTYYLNVPKSP